jgi:hypothetical protein
MSKFDIFPISTEYLVDKMALCDICKICLKLFSEGDFGAFEDQEYPNHPTEQGKP